jgi:SEC-C motif-containing protein
VARGPDFPCPCRARETKPLRYVECCGRWHAGLPLGQRAPTAEALMRSRYSAYALAQGAGTPRESLVEYLMDTWHPSTRPADLPLRPMKWTGLDVLRGEESGDTAVVEFIAHHKVNGRGRRLHETSRFVREAGVWRYVEGEMAPDEGPA